MGSTHIIEDVEIIGQRITAGRGGSIVRHQGHKVAAGVSHGFYRLIDTSREDRFRVNSSGTLQCLGRQRETEREILRTEDRLASEIEGSGTQI
jgi:predicted methyltransferase MtxX (methanogen marker protein 4)